MRSGSLRRRPRLHSGPWSPRRRRAGRYVCRRRDGVAKVKHPNREAAEAVAAELTADKANGETWHAYECPACSTWHVGRPFTPRFDQCDRLRFHDAWVDELGERAATRLWQENHQSEKVRHDYLWALIRDAWIKALTAAHKPGPRRLP